MKKYGDKVFVLCYVPPLDRKVSSMNNKRLFRMNYKHGIQKSTHNSRSTKTKQCLHDAKKPKMIIIIFFFFAFLEVPALISSFKITLI